MTVLVSTLSGRELQPVAPQQLPIMQQQPHTMSQSTEEMAMETGMDQGDRKTTDGTEVQQSGSQGLTEDANAT